MDGSIDRWIVIHSSDHYLNSTLQHLRCDHRNVSPILCSYSSLGLSLCLCTQRCPSKSSRLLAHRPLGRLKRRTPILAVCRRWLRLYRPSRHHRQYPTGPGTEFRRDHIRCRSGSPGAAYWAWHGLHTKYRMIPDSWSPGNWSPLSFLCSFFVHFWWHQGLSRSNIYQFSPNTCAHAFVSR